MGSALSCSVIAATATQVHNSKVILDCVATDHFFCNRDFSATYTQHYLEFQTGSGQILPAYGYGDVRLIMIQWKKETKTVHISQVS